MKKLLIKEAKGLKVLGSATAPFLGLASYQGYKHVKDFHKRVVGYTCRKSKISNLFNEQLKDTNYSEYTFYEKKER